MNTNSINYIDQEDELDMMSSSQKKVAGSVTNLLDDSSWALRSKIRPTPGKILHANFQTIKPPSIKKQLVKGNGLNKRNMLQDRSENFNEGILVNSFEKSYKKLKVLHKGKIGSKRNSRSNNAS